MDLNSALCFGQLVNAAYAVSPSSLDNRAGQIVNAADQSPAYEVVSSIYANDLATDMNPERGNTVVSAGLVLQQEETGDVVVAIRGTEGIMEWVQDAKFLMEPCPFLRSGGNTEDGFTDMYKSMRIGSVAGSDSVAKALPTLAWQKAPASITVCGHSLGGALATFLALDLAVNANSPFDDPTVYTYASPRTGDPTFVATYNHAVPNTFRIGNRLDLVPKLPLPPLYEHVLGLFELNPIKLGLPPKVLIKADIPCEHFLSSYLFLLGQLNGAGAFALDPKCVP